MSENTLTPEVRLLASQNNWIEGAALQQLEKTAALPGMRLAVGLPDLHPGKGSPVGAAFITEDWLYPTLVGSDIGCGIGLWRTGLSAKAPKREAWADRLRHLDGPWPDGVPAQFLRDRQVAPSPHDESLGTIGSGNHFAELQAVETIVNSQQAQPLGITKDAVYLCVHSGSRGFGTAVLREHTEELGAAGLAAGSARAAHYLRQHEHARHWAAANRELVAVRLLERLRTQGERLIDLCHNWVEPHAGSNWIHRKGAAPSTGGAVVIPGSRGAFTYVVMPRDPGERSAYSLAHGAGRKWSRSECRGKLEKRFSSQALARTDLGSVVICEDKELLYEEAPQAYKNITIVIDDLVQAGLAEVVAILKPLVTYKVRR